MVLSWILRAVSPTIASVVLWIDSADGVWKDLKKRFSQRDVFRIAEIQFEIHQTEQGNSSINDYFSQLKMLWDELFVLRPIPHSFAAVPSCQRSKSSPRARKCVFLGFANGVKGVFGCLAFAAVPSCQRIKFSPRARKCVFLGFANGVKGYKLFDIQTREVFLSRDVSFYESVFPFQKLQNEQPTQLVLPSKGVLYPDIDDHVPISTTEQALHEAQTIVPSQANDSTNTDVITKHQPRRSARIRTTPAYLNDYTLFPSL
nr:uncharacterized protein LOC109166898 [Ipomoea batatas]